MRTTDINTGTTDLGLNNATEVAGFKFDANNAFFFRSMIDGLYSDKVSSVVREIIANAIDAHAMAKTKPGRPVEVGLPTLFSPTFSVRDFGDGMTHEFVMELYTTLGHSSKTRTNMATGMFGLGAKTPFAISDAFEVRVYQDGEERTYRCFYNDKNCPALALASRLPSSEPNGVKVIVPVADRDMHREFETAVDNAALCYFDQDVKFNRATSSGQNIAVGGETKIAKHGDRVYTRRGNGHRSNVYNGDILVRQGFATYPLSLSKLPSYIDADFMNDEDILTSVVDNYYGELMIDCPIGTFEVTPSREAVQYTPASVKNLTAIVFPALDAARAELMKLVKDASTYPEALANLLEKADTTKQATYINNRDRTKHYRRVICDNFNKAYFAAHGKKVDWMSGPYTYGEVFPDNYTPGDEFLPGAHRSVHVGKAAFTKLGVLGAFCYNANVAENDSHCSVSKPSDQTIYPFTPVLYIPTDLRNWEDRAHHYMRSHKTFPITGQTVQYVIIRAPRADLPLVKDYVDAHNVVTIDEIDDTKYIEPPKAIAPRANRVSKPRPAANDAFSLNANGSWVESKNVDFNEPCYLVVRDKRHGVIDIGDTAMIAAFNAKCLGAKGSCTGLRLKSTLNESAFGKMIRTMRTLGVLDEALPIYSLNRSQYERVQKLGATPTLLTPIIVDSLETIITKFKVDIVAAMAVKQQYSSSLMACFSMIESDWRGGRLQLVSALTQDKLVLALYGLSKLTAHSFSGAGYIPASAQKLALDLRSATNRYDDALSAMADNYADLFMAHNVTVNVPHVRETAYPLLPDTYHMARTPEVEEDAIDYVRNKIAKLVGMNDAKATAVLNALPQTVRDAVSAIMKGLTAAVDKAVADRLNQNIKVPSKAA